MVSSSPAAARNRSAASRRFVAVSAASFSAAARGSRRSMIASSSCSPLALLVLPVGDPATKVGHLVADRLELSRVRHRTARHPLLFGGRLLAKGVDVVLELRGIAVECVELKLDLAQPCLGAVGIRDGR